MTQVNAAGRPRSRIATFALVGTVALATLALILALALLRGGDTVPASSPSPSGSVAAVASGSPTAIPGGSVSPNPPSINTGPAQAPKPDAKHGLITFDAIRTEDSALNLQQPPQFARTGAAAFNVAVSPDGKRVAMIRSGQTGQQLITFAAARPNDVTVVLDFAGTGEFAVELVWAGDGSDYILFSVDTLTPRGPQGTSQILVSALRTADLAAKKQSEIARLTTGLHLVPLAWRFDTHNGGAIEQDSSTGAAAAYDVIRGNSLTDRTPLTGVHSTAVRASRDGTRVLAVAPPAVRWWPVDQPGVAKEVLADLSKGRAEHAEFRPGTTEIGVSVAAASTVCCVGPPGHFEIWDLSSGKQRVVSPTVGFSRWRIDGSSALDGSDLVDPDTGATTPLPGGAFKIAEVVLF